MAFCVLAASGLGVLAHQAKPYSAWAGAVALAGFVAVLAGYSQQIAALNQTPRKTVYTDVGRWVNQHTEPNASLGYIEIGWIGYYSRRRIIDQLGLVNPGIAEASTQRKDFMFAFRKLRPDYIVYNPAFDPWMDPLGYKEWLHKNYAPVQSFHVEGSPTLTIYHKRA
jgi:hypothetical protein